MYGEFFHPLLIQRQSQKTAKQQSGLPVFSVEEEAGCWRDRCTEGTENEEESWTERENETVFVIPTTPQTPGSNSRWEYLKGGDADCTSLGWVSELQDGDTTTLGSSSEDTLSHDLERVSLGSLGKWTWDIHSIILDLTTANFIDTVAIKTMKNVSSRGINMTWLKMFLPFPITVKHRGALLFFSVLFIQASKNTFNK